MLDTAGDLIAAYREEANDFASPPFLSDTKLLEYANEAINEACRRAHLLVDSTSNFCSVAVAANDPLVQLDPRIINVRRLRLSIAIYPLVPVRAQVMDDLNPGWESHAGTPTHYVTDYQSGHIRLYPKQGVSCSALMSVSRLPLAQLTATDSDVELREEHRPALVQWMLFRAYSKQDTDLFDPLKAKLAEDRFIAEFGRKVSARNERWGFDRTTVDTPTIA